jgi:hypothetical protein
MRPPRAGRSPWRCCPCPWPRSAAHG